MNLQVVFEDNHLIAVVKPAGVLSQPDKTGDVSMYDIVKNYIRIKKGKTPLLGNARSIRNSEGSPHTSLLRGRQRQISSGVFLGLLHRLDRPVSGIILFAKTSKGASRLSEQFRNHEVRKTYQAIVIGKPLKNKGILINTLIKDEKLKKGIEKSTGKEAKLYYKLMQSNDKYSLLKINIEGGQFHQIRTQLSLAGFPILGDVKYLPALPRRQAGGRQVVGEWSDSKSIALSATGLSFISATGGEKVNLSIKTPKKWDEYLSTDKT